MVGPPLTVAVLMPPAVPLSVTPALLKPLTGSLKTAVKLIGELLVGSAWPAAWLIVTEGGVASKVTLLSVLVEAVLRLPAASCATPTAMLAITVTVLVPPAVPLMVTPAPLKPLTGSLNTAVKLIGELLVGSAWPAAWLMVTAGGVVSGGAGVVALAELDCAERLPAAS